MARTYRRKRARHTLPLFGMQTPLDLRTRSGRKALSAFHANRLPAWLRPPPQWLRRLSERQFRFAQQRMLKRCLSDAEFAPVFQDWHKHGLNSMWW